jgi:hypothetical protein
MTPITVSAPRERPTRKARPTGSSPSEPERTAAAAIPWNTTSPRPTVNATHPASATRHSSAVAQTALIFGRTSTTVLPQRSHRLQRLAHHPSFLLPHRTPTRGARATALLLTSHTRGRPIARFRRDRARTRRVGVRDIQIVLESRRRRAYVLGLLRRWRLASRRTVGYGNYQDFSGYYKREEAAEA